MGLICILALSVSLDSLSIGMAYAMKGVRIPWSTRVLIGVINITLTALAVYAGQQLEQWISIWWFGLIGGCILIGIGAKTLWNAIGEKRTKDYDRDLSCSIEPAEGIVLAASLALDSMCAALGIHSSGTMVYAFPVLTGTISVVLLSLGFHLCKKICRGLWQLNGMAGCVLIVVGVLRLVLG